MHYLSFISSDSLKNLSNNNNNDQHVLYDKEKKLS